MGDEAGRDAVLVVADDVLGAEAVADGAELRHAPLLPQPLDGQLDDGVDGRRRVRVVARGALRQPLHQVEALRRVQRHRVPVEHVDDQRLVPVRRELVRDQLAVLPDPYDVRDDEDPRVLVCGVGRRRRGEVGVVLAHFDRGAGRLASGVGVRWLVRAPRCRNA